jgi:hypothetical protein
MDERALLKINPNTRFKVEGQFIPIIFRIFDVKF